MDPLSDMVHFDMGMNNASNHQPEKAEAAFTEGIKLDPSNPFPHLGMALLLSGTRQKRRSLRGSRKSAARHPHRYRPGSARSGDGETWRNRGGS
jgi:Tfp pilus assembly protein PilF